ncbi:MAG: adenosylmethionine decarboxylase [Candidatus Jordarchaeaceae archaeon]
MERALALHIIGELFTNSENIDNLKFIKKVLIDAAKKAGLTILNSKFHKFEPQGVSGFIMISESHLSIHTWPESGYVAIDVFTCGEPSQCRIAYDFIVSMLKPAYHTEIEIKRGRFNRHKEPEKSIVYE